MLSHLTLRCSYHKQSQRSSTVPLSEWAAERLKQQELLPSRAKLTQQKQDKANLTKKIEKCKLQAKRKPQSKLPVGPSDSTETRQSKRLLNSIKTVSDDFQPGDDLVLASYPDSSLGKGRHSTPQTHDATQRSLRSSL